MNKKRLLITTLTLCALGVTAGITWYFVDQRGLELPVIKKETPIVEEKELTPLPESFVLLPENYIPTDEDLAILNSLPSDTIIISENEVTLSTETKFTTRQIGTEYTKCNTLALADQPQTDNTSVIQWNLDNGDCIDKQAQNIDIIEINCQQIDSNCITEATRHIANTDSYIYIPLDPLLSIYLQKNILAEQKYNQGYILTWETLLKGKIGQKAYSFEITEKDKRIYSSGKIDMYNSGDFYFPMAPLVEDTEYEIILRLWVGTKDITINDPILIKQKFTHTAFPKNIELQEVSNTTPVEMSWIPDWGMAAGIASVKSNPKKWDTISPVWFWPNKDGTLKKEANYNNAALISMLKQNNIKLLPTITLFDADILKEVLNKNMDKHINEIVSVVVKSNYAGIDLDYESTYKDDKELLIEFLTKLQKELHAKNKTLSFTVVPKVDDREIYAFLPQTHFVQDWEAIGNVVDEFRIMAYDFTGQGSVRPGPLSPISWNEALIQYAVSKMPAEKVVLALPLYSHAWPKPTKNDPTGVNNDKSLSSGKLKTTYSWQHDDIAYVSTHSDYYKKVDHSWAKEVKVEMLYKGVERVMYYLDKKAVNERLELAKKYGIKGVCYWRIGGEEL